MFYVRDPTVGASQLFPVQHATLAPVPASKEFNIKAIKTTTTQRPAANPNLTITKSSPPITMLTTAARNQTTLSAHTPPSGPGNVYT